MYPNHAQCTQSLLTSRRSFTSHRLTTRNRPWTVISPKTPSPMKTPEEKIQFKNHFFKLGQGRVIPASDVKFWSSFWAGPRDASDIFDLLTPYDIQTVRDQNLVNVLVLCQVLISKVSGFARGGARNHQEMLNCVRFLAKVLPFVFELPGYHTDIEPRFFLAARFDPVAFSAGSPVLPEPSEPDGTAGSPESATYAATLVFSLVRLLFVHSFTADTKLYHVDGSALCLWEPGLGNPATYQPPDAIYDSHRSDILKLLLVLVGTTFYDRVPNVVTRGSVFLTLLVSAVPKQDFFNLVCSLTNLVCRSGSKDSGWGQDHASLVQSRIKCSVLASQLLASMLVYAMPGAQYTRFLAQNGILESKPINRTRAFFSRISREYDLVFLSSHLLGILRSPMLPMETNGKQRSYRNSPSPLALAALVLFWETMHCNTHFMKLVAGRFAVKLVPCVLYHVFSFYDVPQHAHSVKVAAYFLLYLCSHNAIVKTLLMAMPDSYMDLFPPEFRLPGPISTRDFVIVHACQVLIAITAESAKPIADTQNFILPTLVDCLYNIIACTSSALSGSDNLARGLANLNPNGGISYSACRSVNLVLQLFSSRQFLTKAPGNAEMLAMLLRALCAAATKTPNASRMLLFSFLEEEVMYNNIWNSVHGLENSYFCGKTAKLLNVLEDDETKEQCEDPADTTNSKPGTPQINTRAFASNNTSTDQLSINSESSDDLHPNSPRTEPEPRGTIESSIQEMEDREIDEALRPNPPSGMSAKAKEKLPRNTPINVSWGGNDALRTILIFLIPTLKEKLGDSWNKRGSVQDAYKIVKKIESSDMAAAVAQYRQQLHYDFLPETPVAQLTVSWNYVSLGWYYSMLASDIYNGTEIVRLYIGADKSLVSNISSSLAMFGKFATGWGMGSKIPDRQDAAITDYLDANFSPTNVWATTAVKLFKLKRDDDRVIHAFGMRFGSVGSATSVNDITNSLVKRFSDFRGSHRSSISSAGSVYSNMDDIPEGAKLTKRDSVSSLHSLNTLNRARSNTPRNSIGNWQD